jgi:hypothetical protein
MIAQRRGVQNGDRNAAGVRRRQRRGGDRVVPRPQRRHQIEERLEWRCAGWIFVEQIQNGFARREQPPRGSVLGWPRRLRRAPAASAVLPSPWCVRPGLRVAPVLQCPEVRSCWPGRPGEQYARTRARIARKVDFGKRHGPLWTEVPTDYLNWVLQTGAKNAVDKRAGRSVSPGRLDHPDVIWTVQTELRRRGLRL